MFGSDQPRRRIQLLVLGSLLLLVAGACANSADAADEVATLEVQGSELEDAADAATIAAAEAAEELSPDEAALEFSACMRNEGLDFPDLSVNASGEIELRDAFQSVDRGADGFQEALEVCGEILQQSGFGGGRGAALESTEIQDALLEFSSCLRTEGYDVGDLTLGAPGPGQGQGQAKAKAKAKGRIRIRAMETPLAPGNRGSAKEASAIEGPASPTTSASTTRTLMCRKRSTVA